MKFTQQLRQLAKLFSLLLFSSGFSLFVAAQSIHLPEPIDKHYKIQAALSNLPEQSRSRVDTITFPWNEYSKGALSNSLWRTTYLLPEDEAKLYGLVRFPANSSDQTRAELDYLLQLQNKRTASEIQRAQFIADIGSWPNILNPTDSDYVVNRQQLFYIASAAIGKDFNYQNFPATTELLLNCIQDTRVTEFSLKRYFKRPRPYHLEPALKPLMRIGSPSFPSGHSLWAFTQAFIFSELLPANRADFIKKAEEVRWSRELLGIHYPGDNEASRIISWHLLQYWYNNPRFVADLEKARIEWSNKDKTSGKR